MQRVEEGGWKDAYAWYWDAVSRWPEVFDQATMRRLMIIAEQRAGDDFFAFVPLLRAALLRQVYRAAQGCTPAGCGLHVNRLNNLPVLDDGDPEGDVFAAELGEVKVPIGATSAKIMIVGEGPGEYEQRTGLPLVSFQTLHGSRCLQKCSGFERCYPLPSNLKEELYQERRPQAPCKPASLKKQLEQEGKPEIDVALSALLKNRAERPFFRITTCGELLDLLFIGRDSESRGPDGPLLNWVWRRSWNPRQRIREVEEREATVYTTNAIKCRKLADQHGSAAPSAEQMDLCRRFLDMQVYIVQPRAIIALGKAAVYALALQKDVKITSDEVWGRVLPTPYGAPMLPAPHPSYPLRQQKPEFTSTYKARLVEIFQRARRIAEGEEDAINPMLAKLVEESMQAEAERPKSLEEIRETCTNRDFGVEQEHLVPPPEAPRNRFADIPVASPEQLAARKAKEEAKLRPHVPDETSGLPGVPNLDPAINPVALPDGTTLPLDWDGPTEPPEEEAVPAAMEA